MSNLYLTSFFSSCFLFWWLPFIFTRLFLHLPGIVSNWAMAISIVSAIFYFVGYLLFPTIAPFRVVSIDVINGCERLSEKMTIGLFFPSIAYALYFYILHLHDVYGEYTIPFAAQGIFYAHLFFGFMYLSIFRLEKHRKKSLWFAIAFILLPRILISLNYGRAFIAFGALPIVFIAISRGWLKVTVKGVAGVLLVGVCIVIVPAMLRGDLKSQFGGVGRNNMRMFLGGWLSSGSSLVVFDKASAANLLGECSPILVSLTEQIVPYETLGICTVPHGPGVSASDSAGIATYIINGDSFSYAGTGSTYILDLYWAGGIIAIIVGSIIMGATCRLFVSAVAYRSIFSGIWAESLVRSLFAVRGTYGYMYQRIPSLLFATFLCALIVRTALRNKVS
jgi:hypothetical protein